MPEYFLNARITNFAKNWVNTLLENKMELEVESDFHPILN